MPVIMMMPLVLMNDFFFDMTVKIIIEYNKISVERITAIAVSAMCTVLGFLCRCFMKCTSGIYMPLCDLAHLKESDSFYQMSCDFFFWHNVI